MQLLRMSLAVSSCVVLVFVYLATSSQETDPFAMEIPSGRSEIVQSSPSTMLTLGASDNGKDDDERIKVVISKYFSLALSGDSAGANALTVHPRDFQELTDSEEYEGKMKSSENSKEIPEESVNRDPIYDLWYETLEKEPNLIRFENQSIVKISRKELKNRTAVYSIFLSPSMKYPPHVNRDLEIHLGKTGVEWKIFRIIRTFVPESTDPSIDYTGNQEV